MSKYRVKALSVLNREVTHDLSNVYGCEITLFCEIMPVTKSYFIPKVSLNPCSILKMSENKVKLMHSVYSFFLEFFRI